MINYQDLRRENRLKSHQLVGEFEMVYHKLLKQFNKEVQKGVELEQAISDILDLLIDAMYNNRSVITIIGENEQLFYHEILRSLPLKSEKEKNRSKMIKRLFSYLTISLSVGIIGFIYLYFIGYFSFLEKGMQFYKYNTNYISYSEKISTSHSIEINLSDLDSNVGKIIYQDGPLKIYVKQVTFDPKLGYIIYFRTIGDYSFQSGTVVSGIDHINLQMISPLTSHYQENAYQCSLIGLSGLNKDGDSFAFQLFPSDAYIKEEITFNENGVVLVTLSNLYKSSWIRK